ncbi:MAG: ADP-ribosylglycohydrolase family protein [Candidatus Sericytochromatia bacterium]|nr:ADP-ribosylglycohydrolase family protein [Candidatus Sericytochromatia bacterium]
MNQQAHTMIQAALVADALSLPAHWNYDSEAISARWGLITELHTPPAEGYHGGQPAGGQTHYGVQALVLLDTLAAQQGPFDAAAFMASWRKFWASTPPSYMDGATRQTLAHLEAGAPVLEAGSPSSDWGGASRGVPLIAATLKQDERTAVAAVMAQTELTHRDPVVIEGAAFWTRAVRHVAAGKPVPEALEAAATAEYLALPAVEMLARALATLPQGGVAAVQALGPACGIQGALPATLALALLYADDLEMALIENVMAGGDSAARGLALGALLGAKPGAQVPERWLMAWQARERVNAALGGLATRP